MTRCKNCENEFNGLFCNNCSQPANTSRINHTFILQEFRKTFIHIWDDGLFYTIKGLFIHPGKAIQSYLEGRRIKYIKPFSFLILMIGIYVLLSRYFHITLFNDDIEGHHTDELNEILYTHYTQIQLVLLTVYSMYSTLLLGRKTYNFYELLVINIYLAAQRLIISILIVIPLLAYINQKSYIAPIVNIASIPGFLYMLWTYIYLFKDRNTLAVITKTLIIILLTLFSTSALILLVLKYI